LTGNIRVEFFGLLRLRVGRRTADIAAGETTVEALLRRAEAAAGGDFLDELIDRKNGLLTGTIILVNGENIRLAQGLDTPVRPGDTVSLFSPAGGG
jgi:molybdopterin converting factor small subunit